MDKLRRDKIFREFEETKQIKARYNRFVENIVEHLVKQIIKIFGQIYVNILVDSTVK